MNTSEDKLWQLVVGDLELSLSSANFSTWVATTQAESISTTSAHIRVPNYMTKHYLETKFYQDILDAFTHIDHPIEKITFSIGKITHKQAKAKRSEPQLEKPTEEKRISAIRN